MKTIPAPLQTRLENVATRLAICWHVTKTNGGVIRGTMHDQDIGISTSSYAAADLSGIYYSIAGITGSDLRTNSEQSVDNMEVDGATQDDAALDISVADIEAGVLDNARVIVFECDWSAPDDGQIIHRVGWLGEISRDADTRYKSEVRGLAQILQQHIGWVYAEKCNVAHFGDARCGFDLSSITTDGEVLSVASRREFVATMYQTSVIPSAMSVDGIVRITTGVNSGYAREIKLAMLDGEQLSVELYDELPADLSIGDALEFEPGCDRTSIACKAFDNFVNYRGYGLFIPGVDALLRGTLGTPKTIYASGDAATTPPPTPEPTPDPTPDPPPPPQGNTGYWGNTGIPYSPGVYVLANPATKDITTEIAKILTDAKDSPHLDGIGWRQYWSEVDIGTASASYDWSKIDAALAAIKAHSARLGRKLKFVIDINPKTFTSGKPVVPKWLINNYGGQHYTWSYGVDNKTTVPIFWTRGTAAQEATRAAWVAMWQAFATRYAAEWSNFAWICTHESDSSVIATIDGYTKAGWMDYLEELLPAWRAAAPKAPWLFRINFPADLLDDIRDLCIANTVFLGGPDLKIGGSQESASFDIFRGLNGALPVFHDVQWDNYQTKIGGTNTYQTLEHIFDYASGVAVGAWNNPLHLQALWFTLRPSSVLGQVWPNLIMSAAASHSATFPADP